MTTRGTSRWGVIGLGIGMEQALALQEAPEIAVTAICDSDPEVLKRVGRAIPGAAQFTDAGDLIRSGLVDAVVIATYDSNHGSQIAQALDAGLDVFAEKPLAVTRSELRGVVEALNRNPSRRLTTNTLLRVAKRFSWAKSALEEGQLGRLVHADMTYHYGRLVKILDGWRGREPDYSVTLGGAIHLIDLLLWLSGELPREVLGIGSNLGTLEFRESAPLGPVHHDLRVGLLQFDSGMTAEVGANFSCVLPHFHSVNLFGSAGTFVTTPPLQNPRDARESPTSEAWFYSSRDPAVAPLSVDQGYRGVPKDALLVEFASGRHNHDSHVSEQEAVNAVSVALALDEAVKTGSRVSINYLAVVPRVR